MNCFYLLLIFFSDSLFVVKVGEIERTNRIISGLSIHTYTELKIPIPSTSSPQPSPNTSPSSSRRQVNHSKMNGDHQKRLSTSSDPSSITGTSPPSTGMGMGRQVSHNDSNLVSDTDTVSVERRNENFSFLLLTTTIP